MYGYQQITNSWFVLENTWNNYTDDSSVRVLDIDWDVVKIHSIWDSSLPTLVILPWRWAGVFGFRYLLKDGLLEKYHVDLINLTDLPTWISNKKIALKLWERYTKQERNIQLLAKWWGTYTALHLLSGFQQNIDHATLISGYYNSLIDTTTKSEEKYMSTFWRLLSPNFKKGRQEKHTIQTSINPLLQTLSASLHTPLLLLHGKYDLHLWSGHPVYLKEVLRKDIVHVELLETRQIWLRDDSEEIITMLSQWEKYFQ